MKPIKKLISIKNSILQLPIVIKISNKIKQEKSTKNYSDLVNEFETKIKKN